MDSGYRSPLIDLFRRGDADKSLRLSAARGALDLAALEQVALLMTLLDDPDLDVVRQAEDTLGLLPAAALLPFLARADVPDAIRTFFAARGVQAAAETQPGVGEQPGQSLMDGTGDESAAPEADPAATGDVSLLSVGQRLKLATNGTREQRAQLIRDPNRMVTVAVLSSPKISESEVEAFAKMGSVSEETLRIIGANKSWMKHYGVAHGLVRNPKTPPAVSMQLLRRLSARDVKALATDRNVADSVRIAARNLVARTQK